MRKTLPAFSLMEVAIVLMIIGVIAGMGLPALGNMLTTQKQKLTRDRQERVLQALGVYARHNNKLPWPSSIELRGVEDIKLRRGIIPYKALGISEAEAKDGYNHWMTYVPHPTSLPIPDGRASRGVCSMPIPGLLKIKGRGPGNEMEDLFVALNPQKDFPILALISHGPMGSGASGGRPPKGADEVLNSDEGSDTIMDRALSTDPQNPFSHTVRWVSRDNFMASYVHSHCQNQPEQQRAVPVDPQPDHPQPAPPPARAAPPPARAAPQPQGFQDPWK